MDLPRYQVRLWDCVGASFWLEGKRYPLRPSDLAVKRFLRQLARFSFRTESSSTLPILLALRKEFRTIRRSRPLFGLVWCITRGDPDTRRLAIWLFGRVANRHQTSVVAPLSHDRDVRIRKEVAKALRRLGAWAELREIATREDDPVVRRIAKSAEAPPREFSERMGRFLDNDVEVVETPDEASLGAKSLYVNTTVGDGTPPKSRWYIRLILERIRWLVGRHVSKFSDKPPKPRP